MGDNDLLHLMRENNNRMLEEQKRMAQRWKQNDLRSERLIRWILWPVLGFAGLLILTLVLITLYISAPTFIEAIIKATHQWHALLFK